jgi:hypothetical protein
MPAISAAAAAAAAPPRPGLAVSERSRATALLKAGRSAMRCRSAQEATSDFNE